MKILFAASLAKAISALVLVLVCTQSTAAELPAPSGKILLRVTGNIENFNRADAAVFDLALLESLPVASFTTNSPWTDKPTKYTGVRIHQLLQYVGAKSNNFRAMASDKYWNDLLDIDFKKYPAIISYKKTTLTCESANSVRFGSCFHLISSPSCHQKNTKPPASGS